MLSIGPKERAGFPVAPGALPIVGHLPVLYRDAVGVLQRGLETLGPLIWVDLGFGRWRLFCLGPDSYELLRNPAVNNQGAYDDLKHMAGRSVFMLDGKPHQRARSVLNPPFTPRGLAQHCAEETMAGLIEEKVSGWLELGQIEVQKEMEQLALDVIFRITGIRDEHMAEWHKQYRNFALGIYPIPFMLPGLPRYRSVAAAKWVNSRLMEMIAAARRSPEQKGLLQALANARGEDNEPLGDEELVDNLRMTLFAGHETTASTMSWMLIMLAAEPAHWDALCNEVHSRPGARVPASVSDAKAFPFAEALFRETLRVYTPAWFLFRQSIAPLTYCGQQIPPNTPIAVSPGVMSRSAQLFTDPDQFDPSRWLSRPGTRTAHEPLQFGGGPHFCLGYHLAWLEAVQVMVALVLAASDRGLRPRLMHKLPRQVYYPMGHPGGRARVSFSR